MSDNIRFSKMTLEGERLVETSVRVIKQSDIGKCPHVIFVPEHYRDDGTCKCNDPAATEMKEWGYRWSKKKRQWI